MKHRSRVPVGIPAILALLLWLVPGTGAAGGASTQEEFVRALTTGRTTEHEGKLYTWRDGRVWLVVDGEYFTLRGVAAIVDAVVPLASADVQFEGEPPELAAASISTIDQFAAALRQLPGLRVKIWVGAETETQQPSEFERRRTELVRRHLVERGGIAPERIALDLDPPAVAGGNLTVLRLLD